MRVAKDTAKDMEGVEHRTRRHRGELTGNNRGIVKAWGRMKILGLLQLRCVELCVVCSVE